MAAAHFSATTIPYADLVEGTLYATLLISRNIWFYSLYTGDAVDVTDKTTHTMGDAEAIKTNKVMLSLALDKGLDLLGKPTWRAVMSTREHKMLQPEILFYPVTENVENLVHTYREEARRQEWLEHKTGFLRIRRLHHYGNILASLASRGTSSATEPFRVANSLEDACD